MVSESQWRNRTLDNSESRSGRGFTLCSSNLSGSKEDVSCSDTEVSPNPLGIHSETPQRTPETTGTTKRCAHTPLPLKGHTVCVCVAHVNCQHHSSGALGPSLREMRMAWTHGHWGTTAVCGSDPWAKGLAKPRAGWSGVPWDFIMPLRRAAV